MQGEAVHMELEQRPSVEDIINLVSHEALVGSPQVAMTEKNEVEKNKL